MPVSLRELAKATGFSVATISKVLNDQSHLVRDGTKQQHLTTAKKLGYRSNLVRRSLCSACTNTIGLIVDNIASPFSPIIIHEIQDYLQQSNYFRIAISADFNPSEDARAFQATTSRSIEGTILLNPARQGKAPRRR